MLQFLGSPTIILSFLVFSVVLLFVLFLTMMPRANGRIHPNAPTDGALRSAVEKDSSACKLLGFTRALPEGERLPVECLTCPKLVKCALAERQFSWYMGNNRESEQD